MFSKIKSYVIILIILATPLNSLFLSMLVSSPNSSSAILLSKYTEGPGDLTPNAENGLLWSSTSGLTGELTTSPLIDFNTESELEQIVYIGTEIGLTKILVENGNIYWTHPTPGAILSITPIEDITGDSNKEVLITIDNQQFNNTEMLNGLTGEIIWSYRPTETVWQEGIGFSEQETRSWSGLLIEDISDDGTSDVLISSYKSVFALDASDGSLLWQQSASNDVWNTELMDDDIDSDGFYDVVIGSQDGELMLLSGYDGSIIWDIIAAEEARYIDQTQGIEYTFARNVYDVRKCFDMNGDGKKDILTTDENGYCAIYDVITGGLIDRVLAYSRTGPEADQSTFGSKDFYNPMSMDVVDDYGLTKVLTAARSDAVFSNLTLSLLNLGMNDLYVDWSISSVNIEDVRSIATSVATVGNETYTKMIIPTGIMGSSQFEKTIEVYALFNNSLIAQWNLTVLTSEDDFQLNFGDTSDGQYPFNGNHAFFVRDFQGSPEEEVLIYLAGYGLYLLDGDTGDLLWSQIKSAKVKIEPYFDVNSDSTIDILRKEYYYLDQYSTDRFRIPRITMISGDSGETIWDHEIDYDDRELVGGGYISILQAEDITNDSIPDLWLAQQEYDNWEFNLVNVSKVKLLDGATGAIIWESLPANSSKVYSREQMRLTSLATIADQDSDEIQDILVGCQRSYIYCISGFDGAPIWNITREAAPIDPHYRFWIPYYPLISGVGNIQGNTTDDFVILGDGQVQLVDSDNFTTVFWSWFNPLGWIDEQFFEIHINWPQNELFAIFTINKNDKQYTVFIDLVTGTLDHEILGEMNQFNIQFFAADFNLDGTNDHLLYRPYGSEDFMEGTYIINGITGSVLSFYSTFRPGFDRWYWLVDQLFRIGADSFVDVYEDVNSDGIPEIVSGFSIGKHSEDDLAQGMAIEIIDVSTIPAKVVTYEFVKIERDEYSNPPLLPASYTRTIGDVTGDGQAEILVSLVTPEGEFKTIILDISEEGGVWKEITDIVYDSIIPEELNGTLDGNLILCDLNGRIRAIDNEFAVTITDFQVIQQGVGQYYLEWSSNAEDVMSKIYIDHEVVSTVFTSEAEIFLSGGEHNLTVSVSDRNGISAFTNMIISIDRGGGLLLVWLVVGAVTVSFIGLKIFFRFKRKEDLTDFGPDRGGA